MLILLTHANHLFSDRKQVRKMQPYPPLQTLIAAALLREQGHEVAFHDCTFETDFSSALVRCQPDLVAVIEDNFNFLTKMSLLENRQRAFKVAQAARSSGVPVLVNSSDATGNPQAYLDAGFSAVILGEVENTLLDICRGWPELPAGLYGVASQRTVHDLNVLPMPAWDLVDIERYRAAWMDAHGFFTINLVGSRGCPYRCNWCAKPIHGDRYRSYSPARLAEEIKNVHGRFHPDRIWFADDIFGLSPRWLREFAACVNRSGVRIPFKIQSRCDLITGASADALADAGCAEVWMGAESGSQRILDRMHKGIRVERIAEACESLRSRGIRAGLFLQFGYPGEEWEDIEATIRMVRRVRPDDIGVSVSYPLPGTSFFEIVRERSPSEIRWRDSDDIAPAAFHAFPKEMYRALSDALHAEVRLGRDAAAAAWEQVESLRCACC